MKIKNFIQEKKLKMITIQSPTNQKLPHFLLNLLAFHKKYITINKKNIIPKIIIINYLIQVFFLLNF